MPISEPMSRPVPPPAVLQRSTRPVAPARFHFAILTYGALAATKRCLRSLAATVDEPFSVFVVDNGSTDGTQDWLASRDEPWLHWQWNAHNRGVPGGRNDLLAFALPHLRADDWLVFCDNDLEFEAGWLQAYRRAIARHPQARVLGKVGHLIEVRGDRRVLLPSPATTAPVDVVSGGFACAVRADAAVAIGPFDEQLGLFWHEDDDYCVRALQLGGEVLAVPEAAITHHEHATGVATDGLREGGSLRNQAYLAEKWRAAGWIDAGGWVRQSFGCWQPPEVRDELRRRGGFATAIGRAEFAAAHALLERLALASDAAAEFAVRREPVPRCLPVLLQWQRDCARADRADELVRRLDRVETVLEGACYAARLLPVVFVPQQTAGPVGSGVLAASDFDDPDWLALADELEPGHCARDPHARERSLWEKVSLLLSLQRAGAVKPGGRWLFTAEVPQLLQPWLRDRGIAATATGDGECGGSGPHDVVVLQRTFDPDFVARTLGSASPTATIAFVGDVALDGAPRRSVPVPMQIEHDLLARAGLVPAFPLRTAVDRVVLECCIDDKADPMRRPQLCSIADERLTTSFVAVARRAPAATPARPANVLVPAVANGPTSLRVAVDLRTVAYADSSARGIGHYTTHHLAAIARRAPDVRLCCHLPTGGELPAALQLPNVTARHVDDFVAAECDLVHLPDPMNLALGFDSPLRVFRHPRTTVTFHDLTPLRHYLDTWPDRTQVAYRDRLEQIRRSDALLLCNSRFTADDAVATLGLAEGRAVPILAGCNGARGEVRPATVAAVRARLGIRGPFVLHVGALDPHKNFAASLSAYLQASRRRPLQLVVVGAVDPGIEYFAGFCRSRRIDGVVFTGYLPRADLDALYTEAAGLLFLSRSEGFGFPLLEAMAAGCPVVGTAVTSHPEVVGDAGQLVPVDDPAAAAAALERLLVDPELAAECRRRGKVRAAQFTWDATADRTLAAWRELATGARPRVAATADRHASVW